MAWARVQSKSGGGSATTTTTLALTLGSTPTTGNKLILAFTSVGATPTVSSVKDSNNNALTQLATTSNVANDLFTFIYAMDVPATPSATVTITLSTARVISGVLQEISGLLAGNTTAMRDGTAGSTASGGTTISGNGSTGSPTYSSTAANEYLLSFFADFGNGATLTAPSGYTQDTNAVNTNANSDCVVAYKNSTNGAETSVWAVTTNTGSDFYCITNVAFKLAAGGSADTVSVSDSTATAETVAVTPLAEALTVSDSTTTSDTVAVAIVSANTLSINVSDSAATSQTVAAAQAAALSVTTTDSTTTTESRTINPPSSTPTVNVSDSTATSEWIVIAFDPPITFTLEVNVSDSAATTESKTATLGDLTIAANDATATSETISRLETSFVNAADSTTITETVAVTLISSGTFTINVSDSVATTNTPTVAPLLIPGVAKTDSTSTHESIGVQIVSGTVASTHPPLGGLINDSTTGATINDSTTGGKTNSTRGAATTFTPTGGVINDSTTGATIKTPTRGGLVLDPATGGDI